VTVPRSARAALRGLIDYAGLFPPALEAMDVAVRQYAAYRQAEQKWMLGRFVLPAARLDEFAATVAPYLPDPNGEWRLSVLLGPEVEQDLARIAALNAAHHGVVCDAVEARASSVSEIVAVGRHLRAAGLAGYIEIPVADDPGPLIAALRVAGLRAKIRTGGVTAEAFPTAAMITRFLGHCVRAAVPCKATAGLHHPLCGEYRLTYEPGSAQGTMFGFLNVVLAAAWLRDGATDAQAVDLLLERDPRAIAFTDTGVRWRDVTLLTPRLEQLRQSWFVAIGSCSFREPCAELDFLDGWT